MERVGVAVAGFQHPNAYEYTRLFSEAPEARLISVWDDEPPRGQKAAQRFSTTYAAAYESLLRSRDVEVIVVASGLSSRAELAERGLEAGKSVLCEVPLAPSLEGVDRVLRASRKTRGRFQPCFPLRYSPAAVMGREAVQGGKVGGVVAVTATDRVAAPLEAEASSGAAPAADLLYLVDLLRWYGRSEAKMIYAMPVNGFDENLGRQLGFLAIARFASGMIGSIDASRCGPNAGAPRERLGLEVVGTEGLILLDALSQVIRVQSRGAAQGLLSTHLWGCDLRRELIRGFLAYARGSEEPRADALDGRQALEVALAVHRSASEGRPVSLPLGPKQSH